ncbi:lysR-family transcriptional regulator STM3020 [Vibrio ishigakensis]|uniref:LysR-family transcriptional regulator STM3020 n=1 Tax=Vibrio ishigakensis TaxID=1481914 RepID=A0A0B8P5I6_9VIBR|nr:LysR family transcriptional regulator [Vibrio ishigakensis]GAM61491.1 lysR-family transcriptional regulator STM3020 [Vibrio ishigakensis]GAM69359.1 lysR-family transcriptional regulator [Vibrio sp. JCM 19236]
MIEAIEAFILAAEHNSFSIAAKKLGKSQSAVSQLIHNLEIDLGYDLFTRNGRFISLNDNGEALLKQARMVKAQHARFMQQAEQLKHNQKQQVRIGIDPLLSPRNITRLVQDFEATFPSVEVYLIYRDSKTLNDLLSAHDLDIVIGGCDDFLPASEFHTESIGVAENVWVATEENAKRINKAQELFELSTYRYLIPPQFNSDLLKSITDFASVWWVDDVVTLFQMCHSNSNIACIPRNALDSLSQYDSLRVLNSRFLPKVSKGLVLSWQLDARTRPFCQWISQALEIASKQDYRATVSIAS